MTNSANESPDRKESPAANPPAEPNDAIVTRPGATPVSAAGHTPADQDSEPPLGADDGSSDDPAVASPADRPASPGALH